MKRKKTKYEIMRVCLIILTLFVGIGAVAGAYGMLIDPTGKAMGMDGMLPYFRKLPLADILFTDLLFSGIALLIVNGLTNLTAAALMFGKKKTGTRLAGCFGVTLMLWICIQFYMFPPNFLSTAYFVIGAVQAALGYAAYVFEKQEAFAEEKTDYPNIGSNPKRLVVYFSRMGYTGKLAKETANESGAVLYEVKTNERTAGFSGFLWCGRFGMHRWEMPLAEEMPSLEEFEQVTICSPVWVFSLCAPMRAFCRQAKGRIRKADLKLIHFTPGAYKRIQKETEELIGITLTGTENVVCRFGTFKRGGGNVSEGRANAKNSNFQR